MCSRYIVDTVSRKMDLALTKVRLLIGETHRRFWQSAIHSAMYYFIRVYIFYRDDTSFEKNLSTIDRAPIIALRKTPRWWEKTNDVSLRVVELDGRM